LAGGPFHTEGRFDLLRCPCKEPTLFRLTLRIQAVGIGGRVESAFRRSHLALHVAQDLARHLREIRAPRGLPAFQIGEGQKRVVVEHLLEVRDQPVRIGGVAVKATTDLVVNASRRHPLEGERRQLESFGVARAAMEAQEKPDRKSCGKLHTAQESAAGSIRVSSVRGLGQLQHFVAGGLCRRGGGGFEILLDESRQLIRDLLELVTFLRVMPLDRLQDRREPMMGAAILGREVGPPVERLPLRRQPDAQGPAAASSHRLDCAHVDRVDIRTHLAIHLDGHEVLIQDPGDLRLVEGLVFHDVAPVAGGVADAEEDRTVQLLRLLEGFFTPRVPVHRVVSVLLEVGAGFQQQAIGVQRRAVLPAVPGSGGIVRGPCGEGAGEPCSELRGESRRARK
jgi:hypothetical protein